MMNVSVILIQLKNSAFHRAAVGAIAPVMESRTQIRSAPLTSAQVLSMRVHAPFS